MVPSLNTVATTPALAVLMLAAMVASVSVAPTVTLTALAEPAVKVVPALFQLPSCSVNVPAPGKAPGASVADEMDCLVAS